jgi:integrase
VARGPGPRPVDNGLLPQERPRLYPPVELGRLDVDPWPPAPKGRNRRKSERKRQAVDVKRLPDPERAAAVIQAMRTHQTGSRTYQLMSAVAYYVGLRPSEVVMLRPRALTLPDEGWGHVDVTEADIDWDEPGEPKTGERQVPVPPELVATLREWIVEHELAPADLLFRTRNGRRPAPRTGIAASSWPVRRPVNPRSGPSVPPRLRYHVATRRRTARRGRPVAGPQRRDAGDCLRRRPRRR